MAGGEAVEEEAQDAVRVCLSHDRDVFSYRTCSHIDRVLVCLSHVRDGLSDRPCELERQT